MFIKRKSDGYLFDRFFDGEAIFCSQAYDVKFFESATELKECLDRLAVTSSLNGFVVIDGEGNELESLDQTIGFLEDGNAILRQELSEALRARLKSESIALAALMNILERTKGNYPPTKRLEDIAEFAREAIEKLARDC